MCTVRFLLLLCFVLTTGGPGHLTNVALAASDQERAGARAVATQAFDAYNKGDYERAIDLLQRAESLIHSPAHWLYIGRSYERLGQLVLAQEAYLKAAREPLNEQSSSGFRQAVNSASAELELLQPRIPRLMVKVVGANEAQVMLNGVPVPSALVGVPMPVDPGPLEVTATSPGMLAARKSLTLAEGGQEVIELRLVPEKQIPTAASASPPVAPPEVDTPLPAQPDERDETLLYVGAGAAVVGAVAVGIGIHQSSQADEPQARSDSLFAQCNANLLGCSQEERSRIRGWDEEATHLRTVSWVWLGVGAAGVAAGATLLVLHFTQPDGDQRTASPRVSPWVGINSFGLAGTF